MMHPAAKDSRKNASDFDSSVGGVHHSALWCWNYVGENPACEPNRVFLQIPPIGCLIRPNFEGKEKDPPYLASLFPELMSLWMAEEVGFEPTEPFSSPDFESGPL